MAALVAKRSMISWISCAMSARGAALAIELDGALFSWVIELHPELRAGLATEARSARERLVVAAVFDGDVARLAERASIHHHVARNDDPRAAASPRAVQPLHALDRNSVVIPRERFAHGRLEEPVLRSRAVAEHKRLGHAQIGR
jgi:hypothetical protein